MSKLQSIELPYSFSSLRANVVGGTTKEMEVLFLDYMLTVVNSDFEAYNVLNVMTHDYFYPTFSNGLSEDKTELLISIINSLYNELMSISIIEGLTKDSIVRMVYEDAFIVLT